jgi:hypothetical protein
MRPILYVNFTLASGCCTVAVLHIKASCGGPPGCDFRRPPPLGMSESASSRRSAIRNHKRPQTPAQGHVLGACQVLLFAPRAGSLAVRTEDLRSTASRSTWHKGDIGRAGSTRIGPSSCTLASKVRLDRVQSHWHKARTSGATHWQAATVDRVQSHCRQGAANIPVANVSSLVGR